MGNDDALGRLDHFKIEVPSWGFADTGTRFGKFFQQAAARTIEEKLADAGQVHKLTGATPTVAVHVLWDFKPGQNPKDVAALAAAQGVKIGSINPNIFQDQQYKWGSLTNRDPKIREQALRHCLDSIAIGQATGSNLLSLWMADGTNYPGQADIISRKRLLAAALKTIHDRMPVEMTLLLEYKPFEPAFYHTDIADWGMALLLAQEAGQGGGSGGGSGGGRARVLVDTGHHYLSANIEQIVAWLLDANMLGGFHFNDRKFADDDLTLGSIDPYQVFRIFHEIFNHEFRGGSIGHIAYMVDQSHNLKPKIEAMLQTVDMAQQLFLKAALVDRKAIAAAQAREDVVKSEALVRDAFLTDVRPLITEWRKAHELPVDPVEAHCAGGYEARVGAERRARHGTPADGGYA